MRRLFIFLSIIPALVWGQDSLNVRRVGGFPYWDGPFGVTVVDTLAYVAAGLGGLRIVNIADSTNPIEIGYFDTPGKAVGVGVRNNVAYVADGTGGLRIIDVSDPYSPGEINSVTRYGAISRVIISGERAYVSGLYEGLSILDISNLNDISRVGQLDLFNITLCAVLGNYAYVIDEDEDWEGFIDQYLRIIDITDPLHLHTAAFFHPDEDCYDATVVNDLLYVTNELGELMIVDISNPETPVQLSAYDLHGAAYHCEIYGNYAYVSAGSEGLRIVDISDSTAPFEVGLFDMEYSPGDLDFKGNLAFLADQTFGLRIVNITNPAAPFEVGAYHATGTYGLNRCIAFRSNYAIVAEVIGIRVYDITDIRNPIKVSDIDTLGASDFVIQGNYAYVLGGSEGIRIVDVSDPSSPIDIGFYELPGYASDIAIWNNHLLVDPISINPDTSALQILNISSPLSPSLVGIIELWAIGDIEIVGNILYLPTTYDGLRVFDISTPSEPVEIGSMDLLSGGSDIKVRGNIAYVANCDPGLQILDISDPTAPFNVATFETEHCARQLDYWDSHIYVADSRGGTRVIDVSDPYSPTEVGHYRPTIDYSSSHSGTHFVIYNNGNIYAAETHSFSIYDISAALSSPEHHKELPTAFSLHPIYPNPFNNTANIAFDLPREVTGRLVVYDVLGRMTNTLFDGKIAAGSHQMPFNGENLSSGAYFVRLETQTFSATQKAVLLK